MILRDSLLEKLNKMVEHYDELAASLSDPVIINDQKIDICKGDEFFIPKNVPHAGEFIAGTRTIHCFGGKRANRA